MGRTLQRHAMVDTAQAVRTPLEQSSAQAASMAAALATPAPVLHRTTVHALQR
ncbi:hypothetical protein ACO2Q2_12805 [Dyella sp. KRB-257]|uniref:hypothetical protein n=1 Tax=Dyella sp. KRB-257 TaxID=3400915 RepID=UPI003C03C081